MSRCTCVFHDGAEEETCLYHKKMYQHIEELERQVAQAREDAIPIADIQQQIDHIAENGIALAEYGGQIEQEGRCRELCAMYLQEFITAYERRLLLEAIDAEIKEGEG